MSSVPPVGFGVAVLYTRNLSRRQPGEGLPGSAGGGGRGRRAARGVVGLVVPNQEGVFLRRLGGDGAERAEVHEERAVTVETDDAHVGPRERDGEPDGGARGPGAARVRG